MSHDHPRLSFREQFKEGDEEADRGNDGKTTALVCTGTIAETNAITHEFRWKNSTYEIATQQTSRVNFASKLRGAKTRAKFASMEYQLNRL